MTVVREFSKISCYPDKGSSSIDHGYVSKPTFQWLLKQQAKWKKLDNSSFLEIESNRNTLKLVNYVGFLQSPTGESLEILPKIEDETLDKDSIVNLRLLLQKMIMVSLNITPRVAEEALLQGNLPLYEWVMHRFLSELASLVKKGISSNYHDIEETSRYIRGQLNISRQSRQTPSQATWFHIRHSEYNIHKIENRLLKTALGLVLKTTNAPENWRLANELNHHLFEIQEISHPQAYLSKWQTNRLMQRYKAIYPWCKLILEKVTSNFQKGDKAGIALLFPMEKLFESYVAHHLKRTLCPSISIQLQAKYEYFVTHHASVDSNNNRWFRLEPDIFLSDNKNTKRFILDTKWKKIDSAKNIRNQKYNIQQSDLYQLFAYGQKYMQGVGNMMLIYPYYKNFKTPLPKFSFDDQLHLWAVPFDLHKAELVSGDWENDFSIFPDKIV